MRFKTREKVENG